jgi:hypothetical protein
VSGRKVKWNLNSGTFEKVWRDETYKRELIGKLNKAFEGPNLCDFEFQSPLYEKPGPTKRQMEAVCQSSPFDKKWIVWQDGEKPVCDSLSCF